MEERIINNYNSPNVEVIDIEIEGGICLGSNNATHEGTSEEDWEDISS